MTVEELMARATPGPAPNRRRHFRPSMFFTLVAEPFNVWCDYHAPAAEKVDETSRYEDLRMRWGVEHEDRWVKENYPDAVEIPKTYDRAALRATFEAMRKGARAIHAPQLWLLSEELYGQGDILLRDDSHGSDLGPYHYRVVEIKRSKSLKADPRDDDYKALQAMAYHRILGKLQGYEPQTFTVVLRDGQVDLEPDGFDPRLDHWLDVWRRIRDGKHQPPVPDFGKGGSPWRVYADKLQEQARDITLLPGLTGSARKKLADRLKVRTAEEADRLSLEELRSAIGPVVGAQAWHRLEARRTGKPVVAGAVDLPRRKRHLYFDFETCDDLHPEVPAHVYMIGCWDGERDEYVVFTARGPGDEERIFREFFAYAGKLEDAALYHWHSFETDTMKAMIPRQPALAGEIERAVGSCVDLKEAVKDAVYFACRTYSIKEVAPTIGFRWKQEDVDAFESMVLYWEYLKDLDPSKMNRIIQYNRDDCEAMVAVDRWLQARDLVRPLVLGK